MDLSLTDEQVYEHPLPLHRKPKYRLIAAFVVCQFLYVVLAIVFSRNIYVASVLSVVATLGYGVAILAWCRFDSRERAYPLSERFAYAVLFFGTLSLIFYFYRSRGLVGGLIATSVFVGSMLAIIVGDSILGGIGIAIFSIASGTPMPK